MMHGRSSLDFCGPVAALMAGAVMALVLVATPHISATFTAPAARPLSAAVRLLTSGLSVAPVLRHNAAPSGGQLHHLTALSDEANRDFEELPEAATAPGVSRGAAAAVALAMAASFVAGWLVRGQPAAEAEAVAMFSVAGETAAEEWSGAQAWSGKTKEVKTVSTIEDISKILPHRYPFLLVDKVIEFEAGKRAVGVKNVTMNEPQFTGHFPERPIMPGVLMIEAMAQLGGIVCLQKPVSDGTGVFFFAGINGVRWRRPVVPGDTLVMEMELISFKQKFGIAKMKGKAYVDGILAVDVEEFTFALAK